MHIFLSTGKVYVLSNFPKCANAMHSLKIQGAQPFFFDTQGAQPLVTDCQRKNESLMGMRNQEHFFLYKSRTLYLLVCEHGANGKGM